MNETNSMELRSTQPLPLFKLTGAGVKVFDAYMLLAIPDRRRVEHLLLQHAFLPGGANAFRGRTGNEVHQHLGYKRLMKISQGMADAWVSWAREIAATRPSRLACCKAILGLLSVLVHL